MGALIVEQGEENRVTTYNTYWKNFSQGSQYLNQLFGHMNAQIKSSREVSGDYITDKTPLTLELCLSIWKTEIMEGLKDQLVRLVLDEVQQDRDGRLVYNTGAQGVVRSLVEVEKDTPEYEKKTTYIKLLEEPYLKNTTDYYRRETMQMIDEQGCTQFMKKAINRLDEEQMRSRKFLHECSFNKARSECKLRMVADHVPYLHGECPDMVKRESKEDLKLMYEMLSHVDNARDVLSEELQSHIARVGVALMEELKPGNDLPAQFVNAMGGMHDKYAVLIKDLFNGDINFVKALNKACTEAVNYKGDSKKYKSSDWLSRYCDVLLKKESKGMSETELDERLDKAVVITPYIEDRDMLQHYMSHQLAKRLIQGSSQSNDAEEALLKKLKTALGHDFVHKMNFMFQDIRLNEDLKDEFQQYVDNRGKELKMNLSIQIYQASAWPLGQNQPNFKIPMELEEPLKAMQEFYANKYSGRRLIHSHTLSNADVKLCHLKKKYVVSMGTFPIAIMLQFNKHEALTTDELVAITELPAQILQRNLQMLLDNKLIVKSSEGEYRLNYSFSSKRMKFKISLSSAAAAEGNQQESNEIEKIAEEKRKYIVQASIVRVMKARKLIKHTMLVQEVIKQCKTQFKPSISLIKTSIEVLIEKEYMKRQDEDKTEYCYIA